MTGASPPRVWPLPSIIAALIALTLLRLTVAAAVPLAPDEAYYWVWSHALAPGYPDHPPMVALWIRIGTSIAGDGPLGIRLLGPISVAFASVLLADAADTLFPGNRNGLRAAVLLNATLLFGVGAIIMTPDAPLLVFWTACLWAMARLQHSGDARWWLATHQTMRDAGFRSADSSPDEILETVREVDVLAAGRHNTHATSGIFDRWRHHLAVPHAYGAALPSLHFLDKHRAAFLPDSAQKSAGLIPRS